MWTTFPCPQAIEPQITNDADKLEKRCWPLDAREGSGDSHHRETWKIGPGRRPEAPPTFFPPSNILLEMFLVERSHGEKLVQKHDWSPVSVLWIGLEWALKGLESPDAASLGKAFWRAR